MTHSMDPWYREGLRFQCTGCGDCCTGEPGFVWVNQKEIEALAEHLALGVEEFAESFVRPVGRRKSLLEYPSGDCVFFDRVHRSCKVYEFRPRQCRTWPFWDSNLATQADWEETCRSCPGCGRGPVVALEVIERQKRVFSL